MILGWSRHANIAVSWAKSSAPITNFRGCALTAGRRHFSASTLGLRMPLLRPSEFLSVFSFVAATEVAEEVRIWLTLRRLPLLTSPSPLVGIKLRSLLQLNARESMLSSNVSSSELRVRLDDHPAAPCMPRFCSGKIHVTSNTSQKFPLPKYSPMIRSDFFTWGTLASFLRSMTLFIWFSLLPSPVVPDCCLSEWSANSCSRRNNARFPAYSSMRCCSVIASPSPSLLELVLLLLLLRREADLCCCWR
mmetsp:Transcript_29763/g.54018  ORF Transcript_29763/g.54018 Transcript_29763/m.54018 type:complete len:248 (+) Transcript_29763:1026-1769(+)